MRGALVLGGLASVALAAPAGQAADCTKQSLMEAADAYVASQTAGSVTPLQKFLGSNASYVENNKDGDLKTGILATALKIDNRRTNTDLVECASYTELISAGTPPYVTGTQIHHGPDGKIKLVDSIVSTTNSWIFDAKKTLSYVQGEKWDAIPEAKWDSRTTIKNAGDAYMDIWSNATAADAVPWGTPCTRLEGSAYTGKGKPDDSCKPGLPSNHNQAPNTHRRYVIDQEMGSVSIFCVWEHMMNAADSHEFRLENGKLRYVHTMTVCGGKKCSL